MSWRRSTSRLPTLLSLISSATSRSASFGRGCRVCPLPHRDGWSLPGRSLVVPCLLLCSGWKTAFPSDHYSRYQFHLRGVQQILDGLESASFNPTLLQARSRSPHTGNRSPSSSRDRSGQQLSIADRRKQHSRTRTDLRGQSPGSDRAGPAGLGSAGGDPADYKSACKRWVDNKANEGTTISISVAGGTKLAEERACALAVLDWALSTVELEARIQR
jgi:hypothetical protein